MKKIVALVLTSFCFAAFVPSARAGVNLLPNAGFESSVVGGPTGTDSLITTPLLPEGWAFEGAAGLFDYGDDRGDVTGFSPPRGYQGRFLAISIPAGTPRRVCQQEICNDNPANAAKGQSLVKVNPHWRNAVPVAVNQGQNYTLSFVANGELLTQGEGILSSVRWLDGTFVPISESAGPGRRTNDVCLNGGSGSPCPWAGFSSPVTAPSGAKFAVVLLGASDDLWISQVRFDNVFFG